MRKQGKLYYGSLHRKKADKKQNFILNEFKITKKDNLIFPFKCRYKKTNSALDHLRSSYR